MTNKYVFEGGDDAPTTGSLSKALPEGDYKFVVLEFSEPYQKDNGRWVARVKLGILPDDKQKGGQWVFAAPWSGFTDSGKKRDGIGTFLRAVNRAPKKGVAPDWDNIVDAEGRCHLRVSVAAAGAMQGQEVNEVAYFIAPRELDLAPENRMQMPKADYDKALEPEKDDEDAIPW